MNCPRCETKTLKRALTKRGVEVDYCESCEGIWLDKGELYLVTLKPQKLKEEFEASLKGAREGELLSPRSEKPMLEVSLFGGKVRMDYDPETEGMWFDGGELRTVIKEHKSRLMLDLDERASTTSLRVPRFTTLPSLPNLFLRSAAILVFLYGLMTLVLITAVEFWGLAPSLALIIGVVIVIFHFLLGPIIMDFTLRLFYRIEWRRKEELPSHLSNFIERVCGEKKMKFPRIGVLIDGAPQAFTYGHTPNNARVVISRGLFDLLEESEVESVVAHELGHAKHWDMLIMTLAQLIPLVLYYIYRTAVSIRSDGRDKSQGARIAVAVGAYILYIISQYIVLWLSRTREYHADRFAGEVTGNPNLLASALVKIAYGLAGQEKKKEGKEARRSPAVEAIGSLGIFDQKSAYGFAIASYTASGLSTSINPETLKDVMRWDLWNPWAKYYELHSTHPLVARRLNTLGAQADSMGLEPFVLFDLEKPESYWDEFLFDVLVLWLPLLLPIFVFGIFGFSAQNFLIGLGIASVGVGSLIKTLYGYRGGFFPPTTIASLLKVVKVSGVRPVPCKLEGIIIGKGVPGLIWSEDFVMKDQTGILFLDYRQPLRIWEFLFGLLRAEDLQNRPAVVQGWFRRAPVPYLELKSISVDGVTRHCYAYHIKLLIAILLIVLGIVLSVAVFG